MLRFLIDANAGLAIATALRDAGHDVLFVGDLDWRMPDVDVLSLAHREQRIVLTGDAELTGASGGGFDALRLGDIDLQGGVAAAGGHQFMAELEGILKARKEKEMRPK